MIVHPALVFLGGLVVILLGAEMIVRGGTRSAAMLGIKPIVVGLTIVSVGTSAPELAVGITAARSGSGALAVGNIAGTNMLNILFILGLSAAIKPLRLQLQSIKLDVPVMITAALVLLLMALDGVLSRTDGALLVSGAVVYTIALVRLSRKETEAVREEFADAYGIESLPLIRLLPAPLWSAILLAGGLALSVLGAELLVGSAVNLARAWGVSDAIIGLTIVAVGTSAPELATTVVATLRDDRDVAVGNLIGSSISNVLVILGLTCVVTPAGVDVSRDVLWIDLPLAAAVAVVCLPVFRSDQMVSRREGIAFVLAYLAYLAGVVLWRT